MIIAGAGGHAKEVLGILAALEPSTEIFCYDDTDSGRKEKLFGRFIILTTPEEATIAFKKDPRFVIGVGKPSLRKLLAERLERLGGKLTSVVSPFARIGVLDMKIGEGLNIMTGAVITEEVRIGRGTLVNANATVHHESVIGEYCEIAPGCHLLGNVTVGDLSSIGTGAVVLPGIKIADQVIVGAGAVVTKDVPSGSRIAGIPARPF